jgi:hypothetical protein
MIIRTDADATRANGEGWHTDVSCDAEPPMGSILYIKECPPHGGDTLFASMYAAYEALSDRMKAYLDGMTAMHDGEPAYRGLYANLGVADKASYPRAEHPVVRTHPDTGRKALSATCSSTWRTRCSSAASAGGRGASRSGTTGARSIGRCGTTGPTAATATASPSRASARSEPGPKTKPPASPPAVRYSSRDGLDQ